MIHLTGINYKKAPSNVLEKFSLDEKECFEFLFQAKSTNLLKEAVVLSTCNRTEVYCTIENGDLKGNLPGMLTDFLGLSSTPLKNYFYHLSDLEAVSHLFRVAAGLDSMVLGEDQILMQMKKAYSYAVEAKSVGCLFHKLFHQAFRVGKRCRHETRINDGAASIGSVAIELIKNIFSNMGDRKILLIGAGELSQAVLTNLKNIDPSNITIMNRTFSKAHSLAQDFDARLLRLADLPQAMAGSDIIISSTASKKEIISFDMVKNAMSGRKKRPMLIVDIAVPHDVDYRVSSLGNVFLYNIDDLKEITEENIGVRQKDIPCAEEIIDQELQDYKKWYTKRHVVPTIKELQIFFEKIRRQEVERHSKNFSEQDLKELDLFSKSLVKKILHLPMASLNECANDQDLLGHYMIRKVFGLDKHE